ncbi:ADP-ribosylglycohydrolase family protein [Paenisporosarcina sp. NPDC076898]|uniref:ADP-ribosylglycohydrolase family protein n=1 Tax=unclassified Paenisporosarcina TaxID=2642018 RepID=UPI003D0067A7
MLNKIKGALFGVAIGDALGATTEFMTQNEIQDQYGKVTDFIGGGYWQLEPGEVTDDTEMTIAVIKGIMANSAEPIDEIGNQFLYWRKSDPVDIGIIILTVLDQVQGNWFEAAEATHQQLNGMSAGNGSLMRCLPIALAYPDKNRIKELSIQQSKMTHYDDLAAEACVIYNLIACRVLAGEELKTSILTEIKDTRYDTNYDQEPDCPPDGYVVHTMRWVIYWLLTCETFEEVVIEAANKGNDSDTIAAIAGGLKGLDVGFSQLPKKYTLNLLCERSLDSFAYILFLIRDQNTGQIIKNLDRVILDLGNQANLLEEMVEQGKTREEKQNVLNGIKDHIYLYRLSFNDGDHDYEAKIKTWSMSVMRYLRTQRLLDLDAPKIIISHELSWLRTMIEHMGKRYCGIEPQFTEEELEELELDSQISF